MKNAMKKLMSLLLVAVLLVSAVPFQADATQQNTVNLEVKYDDGTNIFGPADVPIQYASASAQSLLNAYITAEYDGITKTYIREKAGAAAIDGTDVPAGYMATIVVGKKAAAPVYIKFSYNAQNGKTGTVEAQHNSSILAALPTVTLEGHTFRGWKVAGTDKFLTASSTVYHDLAGKTIYGYWKANPCGKCGSAEHTDVYCPLNETETPPTGGSNGSTTTPDTQAPTVTAKEITLNIKNVEGGDVVWTTTKAPSNGKSCVVSDMVHYWYSKSWQNSYNCTKVYSSEQKTIDMNTTVNAGDTVTVVLSPKSNTGSDGSTSNNNNNLSYNEYLYKTVYLNIYTDGNVSTITKRVNITDGIAADNYVDWNDCYNVVLSYFNAKTSAGVKMNGLYLYEGNWASNWTYDNTVSEVTNIKDRRARADVNINVMVYNATLKGTYTADSSNPKTGDEIYMAVTALGLSGAALATAMYFFTKKRVVK